MNTRRILIAGALALAMGVPMQAQAQSSTSGAIQGVVREKGSGKSLGGVTVVVTSPALQGMQAAITEPNGFYKITNLPPGTYLITYTYTDITVRMPNVLVSINKTTPAFAKIDTSQAGGEVITIDSKAPSIDPTSTNQGITLGSDYTKNIPIPGRTFESALGAAAGSAGDDLGVSFSGSTSLENSYIVDGVNTTGLTFGTVGSSLITDFIEEIEIITGGYNAEYGRATGGVVNVVTKSGSNEFHGSVFTYITPGFLVAERTRTPSEASSIDVQSNLGYNMDFGFELGGPIVKDKVWFYVGFAPRFASVNVDKITKRLTDCREVLADGSLSGCDPALGDGTADEDPDSGFRIYEDLDTRRLTSESSQFQFVSKINFALAPEHQGQITLTGTPLSGQNVGVNGDPAATTRDFSQLTTDLATKWTSKFNNNKTEVEFVAGWHRSATQQDSIDNNANDIPGQILLYGNLGTWSQLGFESMKTQAGCTDSAAAGDPYPFIENCPDEGNVGYRVGGPGTVFDQKEERLSAKLSVTQRVKAAGSHEIKAGVDVEQNRVDNLRKISGGVFYNVFLAPFNRTEAIRWVRLAPDGNPDGLTDVCRSRGQTTTEYSCSYLPEDNVVGRTLNWSAYIRDSWQILPNLTFNGGIRYEEQRLRYAKELRNKVDPLTGNKLGKNAMTLGNMWAPRVGLLYDWTKEGRSKIYGSWGRFYESIPMQINNRSFGGEVQYRQVFDSTSQCGDAVDGYGGPSGLGCTEAGQDPALDEVIFGSGVLVAPGIKAQYLDEVVLGVEYELMEDLKVGISFQNRKLGRILEDVSLDGADTYILANPGEFSSSEQSRLQKQIDAEGDSDEKARLQNQLDQFVGIRTFDKPRRDYNAVQLTAVKRFSRRLFAQGSYTYSRTTGNYPGLFSADNGQVDPNITSQFDLIELLGNRDGPLPIDRPHYFKIDAYYNWDFKKLGLLTTGIRARALSGIPINTLGRHFRYGTDESFVLPRGEMGRTSFETGIDLHLSYGRNLKKGMKLEVFTDLFNVFNSQGNARVWQRYTIDSVNPIIGGTFEDLIFAKQQSDGGDETSDPVSRDINFRNVSARYSPFSARLGARLTF